METKISAQSINHLSGVIYTCPMHPEIRQKGPGSCPICGMALEPVAATEVEEDPEYRSMLRRFWVSAILSIPVVFLAMSGMFHNSAWLEFIISAPVVLWGGWPFFERGWISLKSRRLNMFTLIALGVATAFVFSVIATVAPQFEA